MVPLDELLVLIQSLAMGPTLAVHVLNTAMRIMSARYPADLVRSPLPPQYDLRKIVPVKMDDREHDTAKALFDRRTAGVGDFTEEPNTTATATPTIAQNVPEAYQDSSVDNSGLPNTIR